MAVAVAPMLPYLAAALLAGPDRAPAGRADRLSARLRSPCSSPGRPTACACRSGSTITAGSWRCLRSACRAIADPKRVRGGIMLGLSTALSLVIGLEMMIYLARRGRRDGAVLGRRRRASAAAARLCGVTGRRRLRSASSSSPRTTIGARCATRCRRCGCRCVARRRADAWRWPGCRRPLEAAAGARRRRRASSSPASTR